MQTLLLADKFFETLTSLGNLAVIVLGFTCIIVLHELGHFLAAKWAGIRVLAFAVGFGPALVSYRKGMGVRRGSSESEYKDLLAREPSARGRVSPTEYRWNALPLGGYVKMLGQDDLDPAARSSEADSYQNARPWKRMVVISAGVIANIVSALLLFIIVFGVGLKSEPPNAGRTLPGSPAATAVATNAAALHVDKPGLLPGDEFVAINDLTPDSFNEVVGAVVMAEPGKALHIQVRRPGVSGLLEFDIAPKPAGELAGSDGGPLSLGVEAMYSGVINTPRTRSDEKDLMSELAAAGGEAARQLPGMELVAVNGQATHSPYALESAVHDGHGEPVVATFEGDGKKVDITLKPEPTLQKSYTTLTQQGKAETVPFSHLLGLTPVLRVRIARDPAYRAGLRNGDLFVWLGDAEWPSVLAGIEQIKAHAGGKIRAVVLRPDGTDAATAWKEVDLGEVPVDQDGQIGFLPGDSTGVSNVVTRTPALVADPATVAAAKKANPDTTVPPPPAPPAAGLGLPVGTRITAVNGHAVATLADVRDQLAALGRAASAKGDVNIKLTTLWPEAGTGGVGGVERVLDWRVAAQDLSGLGELGYDSPLPMESFTPKKILVKGENIPDAVHKGLRKTRMLMATTYLTFVRLAQGSVPVNQLNGPVGIAHTGLIISERGWMWVLFFMALISVNLAVINFLPLPIVDGGHMVYLIYEQITGKQPPVVFQNIAALAGLVLLGVAFLVVTYNDFNHAIDALKHFFKS